MSIKTRITASKPVSSVTNLVTAVSMAKSQLRHDRQVEIVKARTALWSECD